MLERLFRPNILHAEVETMARQTKLIDYPLEAVKPKPRPPKPEPPRITEISEKQAKQLEEWRKREQEVARLRMEP